jgi:hypothetical protein
MPFTTIGLKGESCRQHNLALIRLILNQSSGLTVLHGDPMQLVGTRSTWTEPGGR